MEKNKQMKLSYESDGVMGEKIKTKETPEQQKNNPREFFNTTQSSE
jgi:hypothetical protein